MSLPLSSGRAEEMALEFDKHVGGRGRGWEIINVLSNAANIWIYSRVIVPRPHAEVTTTRVLFLLAFHHAISTTST